MLLSLGLKIGAVRDSVCDVKMTAFQQDQKAEPEKDRAKTYRKHRAMHHL